MPITPKAPNYLQARNIVSIAINGGTAAADGTITWGTAADLAVQASGGTKTFEEFTYSIDPSLEMFKAADATVASYQIEYDDWNATVRELSPSNGTGVLAGMAGSFDYFKVVVLYRPQGASTGGTIVSCIGVRAPHQNRIGSGNNTQSLDLKPFGYTLYIGPAANSPY